MIKHIAKWFCKSTGYFIADLPVTLVGLLVVAVALPFRKQHLETAKPFTDPKQITGTWMLVTLPSWAKPWDNVFDGAWGDKRGWWNTYCLDTYDRPCSAFYSMWQWLAIRNPANYWSRVICGVDVSRCIFTLLAGQEVVDEDHPGWHFIVATDDKGREFHSLEFVLPWFFDKSHAVYGRFGWKIKMSHAGTPIDAREQDRIKGHVYRVSPFKSIK